MMDLLGMLSSAAAAGVAGWLGNAFMAERSARFAQRNTDRKAEVDLETHRDGLTFELLTAAREEMAGARREMEEMRSQIAVLRPLEQHLYHFQQALDHIEAMLTATPDERGLAERNARAFLNRMRRLNDAKGTIANEVQIAESSVAVAERAVDDVEKTKPARQSRTKRKDP